MGQTVKIALRTLAPLTELHFEDSLPEAFGAYCRSFGAKIALFADANAKHLISLDCASDLFVLPSGEACKTREMKQRLEDQLLDKRYGRDSLFIACGGGATTDLVGYLASTFLRGVSCVLLPTTLLAMVDAAIGGKSGVNTPLGKNLIGTLFAPRSIWVCLSFLDTLPASEWLNGYAEILKYGLIRDASLFERMEKEGSLIRSKEELSHLIRASAFIKIAVVEEDPEERSVRRILNFGHTVAHAIEQLSDYKIAHGEAVATGCLLESYLSHLRGYLSEKELLRIQALFKKLGYTLRLPKGSLLEAMRRDKKNKEGKIRFVLLEKIGKAVSFGQQFCTEIEDAEIEQMVKWL